MSHRTGRVAIGVDLPNRSASRSGTISNGAGADSTRWRSGGCGVGGAPDVISTWLADASLALGSMMSLPCGDVVLDESDAPLVLDLRGDRRDYRWRCSRTSAVAPAAPTGARAPRRPRMGTRALYARMRKRISSSTTPRARSGTSHRTKTTRESGQVGPDGPHLADRGAGDRPRRSSCAGRCTARDVRAALIGKGVSSDNIGYRGLWPDLWAQNPANA